MSFGLEVYAPGFTADVGVRWREALLGHGLAVELLPGFTAPGWPGGFLPFKLEIRPGAFPAAERYGAAPILAGFELDFADIEVHLERLAAVADAAAAAALRRSGRVAYLRTATGRSVADLRLQCFAAATLAGICDGVVHDLQQERIFIGDAAIANAAREADQYDANPMDPADWELTPFPGWEALQAHE